MRSPSRLPNRRPELLRVPCGLLTDESKQRVAARHDSGRLVRAECRRRRQAQRARHSDGRCLTRADAKWLDRKVDQFIYGCVCFVGASTKRLRQDRHNQSEDPQRISHVIRLRVCVSGLPICRSGASLHLALPAMKQAVHGTLALHNGLK